MLISRKFWIFGIFGVLKMFVLGSQKVPMVFLSNFLNFPMGSQSDPYHILKTSTILCHNYLPLNYQHLSRHGFWVALKSRVFFFGKIENWEKAFWGFFIAKIFMKIK
jgi:hypothetical protein